MTAGSAHRGAEIRDSDPDAAGTQLIRDCLALLAGSDDLDTVLRGCAQAVVDRTGAASARVWLVDRRSPVLVPRTTAGVCTDPDWEQVRVPVGSLHRGRTAQERRRRIDAALADDPLLRDPAWADREGLTTFEGFPMMIGTRLVGVLTLFSRSPIPAPTLEVLRSIADAMAAGVERIDASERTRNVLERLHAIGSALVSELALDRVVQIVTDAATDLTGAAFGAFFYNVYDEHGGSFMLYSLSGAPRSAFEQFPLPRKTAVFAPTFDGDRTVRIDDVTADDRYGHMEPHRGMPHGHLPVRSYLATPVIDRDGAVIGGLFFGHADAGVFGPEDEQTVEGIAKYAAVALTNARVYEQQRSIAAGLQHALLPSMPDITGLDVAAAYLPANHAADVGGDWFDVVDLGGHRVAVTVGDVAGHDIGAAAHMGTIRSVLRAYALEGTEPGETLRMLDRHLDAISVATLVTVAHAVFDLASGHVELSSAGHLPILVVPVDGPAEYVSPAPANPPLGVGANHTTLTTIVRDAPVGAALVLFTDGLVEQRGRSIDAQLEALRTAVSGRAHLTAAELTEEILRAELTDRTDDIALLVVKRNGDALGPVSATFAPEVGSARAARRWVMSAMQERNVAPRVQQDVALLTSELATNAAMHAKTEYTVSVGVNGGAVTVAVADASSTVPRPRNPEPAVPGGRGLHVVQELAGAWGVHATRTGKSVWFEVGATA